MTAYKDKSSLLASLGYSNTKEMLEHYGNVLSDKHQEALRRVHRECARMIVEGKKGRKAYGLSTGTGKTTSVVGLFKAIHQLGLPCSVMVCQETIDALCNLKEWLVAEGIPGEKVGLLHSKEGAIAEEDAPSYQFLLVTHNKIKGGKFDASIHYKHKGAKRHMCIWDESLLRSESQGLPKRQVAGAIADILTVYEERLAEGRSSTSKIDGLCSFLRQCKEAMDVAFTNIEGKGSSDDLVFPDAPLPVEELQEGVNTLLGSTTTNADRLKKFLAFSQEPCRAVRTGNHALIQYKIVVPEYLDNVVILDASSPIRELASLDCSIEYDKTLDVIKDYSKVSFHHWKGKAGRESVEKDIMQGSDSKVFNEILSLLKTIPEEEEVLIYTFKTRDGDTKKGIIEDFRIKLEEHSLPHTVYFETFGRETNSNLYSNCKHVIFMGILYLPEEAISAKASGQAKLEGLDKDVLSAGLLKDIQYSEQAHRIYQAASRGNSRKTQNGMAGEQHIYLFHTDIEKIKGYLDIVMPNATWERYNTRYMENKLTAEEALAIQIVEKLSEIEEYKISSTKLKKLYFPNHPRNNKGTHLWKRAFNKIPHYNKDWRLTGRSVERVN